jgi:uncharacterized protein
LRTILLLVVSNVFMTFAWYRHLKEQRDAPLYVAILTSWGIACFEYVLAVRTAGATASSTCRS